MLKKRTVELGSANGSFLVTENIGVFEKSVFGMPLAILNSHGSVTERFKGTSGYPHDFSFGG